MSRRHPKKKNRREEKEEAVPEAETGPEGTQRRRIGEPTTSPTREALKGPQSPPSPRPQHPRQTVPGKSFQRTLLPSPSGVPRTRSLATQFPGLAAKITSNHRKILRHVFPPLFGSGFFMVVRL